MSQSDAQLLPRAPAETKAAGRPLDHALVRQIIVGILLAMFLSALEQTIVAPALPTIGRVLADVENLSFVVTAYLLAATAVTPLFGKLADIHGRRAAMLGAVAIFILGSLACALAPTMGALIAARALQGIGGGGILPIAQTIIADLLAPRERPMYQSYSAVMFMAASVLGPVLGGLLTDYLHWSLIFWINVPMGAVALVMTDRALRRLPRYERPHRLDLLGAALMVAAALMVMVALAWGGRRYPWGSPEIVAMIAASVLLWGLFALRLARAPEPFIPPGMLRDRVVRAILVTAFFSIGAIIGLTIMTPLYLGLVLGLNASQSSVALIALVVGTTFGSVIAGRLLARLKRYKRVPVASLAIGRVGRGARGQSCGSLAGRRQRDPVSGWNRRRADVPRDHGGDPERGAAASHRHGDRHAQFLPPARRRDHRRGLRRDRARRARRRGRCGRARDVGGRKPHGGGFRRHVPLGLHRCGDLPGACRAGHDGGRGTAVAGAGPPLMHAFRSLCRPRRQA
jgi:MFS family permease